MVPAKAALIIAIRPIPAFLMVSESVKYIIQVTNSVASVLAINHEIVSFKVVKLKY